MAALATTHTRGLIAFLLVLAHTITRGIASLMYSCWWSSHSHTLHNYYYYNYHYYNPLRNCILNNSANDCLADFKKKHLKVIKELTTPDRKKIIMTNKNINNQPKTADILKPPCLSKEDDECFNRAFFTYSDWSRISQHNICWSF